MLSDCCGAKMTGLMLDHGICPDCKEHCECCEDDNEDECETTIDIVLRRTNRKWTGIVQIDGLEVYRTSDFHSTKESALERADAWFKETMHAGNIDGLFRQILGNFANRH